MVTIPEKGLLIFALCALCACASPTARFHDKATRLGLQHAASGKTVAFHHRSAVDGAPVHIYLDGDGAPTVAGGRVATDPTTRERLILDLIAADPAFSVLIARPCYYDGAKHCDPRDWTTHRYGESVVRHLIAGIEALIEPYPNSKIVLIGYSGGGALAMLVAPRLSRVDEVITIAANLDTTAWAELHGYAPLSGSLNPADFDPLPRSIRQRHYYGAQDENVPASSARHVVARQSNAELITIPGFNHRCCWARIWPSIVDLGS